METVDGIIKYVSEWRQHNSYTLASDGSLSEESLWKLMNDVNSKIEKLAFEKTQEASTATDIIISCVVGIIDISHF